MPVYRPAWQRRRRPQWIGGVPAVIPTNVTVPTITGTLSVGQVLSGSDGTWLHSPTSFTYQWYRDAQGNGVYTAIGGATANTRLLTSADAGCNLIFGVVAINAAGSSAEARSDPSGLVIGTIPAPTMPRQASQLQIIVDDGQRQLPLVPLANTGNWSSAAVGGFADASFVVAGWYPKSQIPFLSKITILYGEVVLFEGRVEDITWGISDSDITTTIDCFGFRRLLDETSTRRIWSKRSLNWQGVPIAPGGLIGNAFFSITRAPANSLVLSAGNYDPTDLTKSGVQIAGASVAIPQSYGDMLYVQFSGLTIKRLMATLVLSGANTGATKMFGYYQAEDLTDATITGQDQGRMPSGAVNQALGANRTLIRLGAFNDSGTGGGGPITPTPTDLAQWSDIRLLGTTITEDVADGFYGGTLLNDIVSLVPGLAAGIIDAGSDFAVPSLERTARTALSDVVSEVASYYQREWGIWEGPRFDWRMPDLNLPHWVVTLSELTQCQLRSSLDGLARTAYIVYTDAATGLDSEASASSTAVRNNPYVGRGQVKDVIVNAGFPMVANSASQLAARVILGVGDSPITTGTITLPATKLIQSGSGGGPTPAFLIRAGQNILIADAPKMDPSSSGPDQETLFHIVSAEADLAANTVTLQLGGFGTPSDVIIARLAAVTRTLTG